MQVKWIAGLVVALAFVFAGQAASAQVPPGVVIDCDEPPPPGYEDVYEDVCGEVIDRPPPADTGVQPAALARTGSDDLPVARVGLVLVAAGAGFVLLAERRRRATRLESRSQV